MGKLKQEVYNLCQDYISSRIQTVKLAMEAAQVSANDETKSSAGDKYETGRAMMQLELEKLSAQLAEALKLKQVLTNLDSTRQLDAGQLGSLVTTTSEIFYLSISAGKLEVSGKIIFAVSPASPVGSKLIGLKAGDTFEQNGKQFSVLQVE